MEASHAQLPPEVFRELKRLELHTRRLADADLVGSYRTAFRGSGLTFSELREYAAGDDVRHIHWKATARGKTAYVKTYEEDRQLNIVLAVDLSRSMMYGSPKSKQMRARELAGLLTTLAGKNQDNVSLCLFADDIIEYVPLRAGRKQVSRLLYALFEPRAYPRDTHLDKVLDHIALHQKKTSLIFLLSDFFSSTPYEQALKRVSSKHDIVCIMIDHGPLSNLPRAGLVTLFDAENGRRFEIDSSSTGVREALELKRERHYLDLEQICKNVSADVIRYHDSLEPLVQLMKRRAARNQFA